VELFLMYYYYDLLDHDTLTSQTFFCKFCGIYGINDLESR